MPQTLEMMNVAKPVRFIAPVTLSQPERAKAEQVTRSPRNFREMNSGESLRDFLS